MKSLKCLILLTPFILSCQKNGGEKTNASNTGKTSAINQQSNSSFYEEKENTNEPCSFGAPLGIVIKDDLILSKEGKHDEYKFLYGDGSSSRQLKVKELNGVSSNLSFKIDKNGGIQKIERVFYDVPQEYLPNMYADINAFVSELDLLESQQVALFDELKSMVSGGINSGMKDQHKRVSLITKQGRLFLYVEIGESSFTTIDVGIEAVENKGRSCSGAAVKVWHNGKEGF